MNQADPIWPELLSSAEAAAYLRSLGVKVTIGTLSNWRVRGTGPRFTVDGNRIRYPRGECEAFARKRLVLVSSTSEARGERPAA